MQHKGTPASRLSTILVEDPHNAAAYASFLVARDVNSNTLAHQIKSLRKVVSWRASKGASVAEYSRLQAVTQWFDKLLKQCTHAARPSPSPMQRTKLPHAKDVLKWQLTVEEAADELLAVDLTKHGDMKRRETIKASQDAACLALCFGYLPTPRLSCIRYGVRGALRVVWLPSFSPPACTQAMQTFRPCPS